MAEQVLVTDDGAVRIVGLNSPERKNALMQAFSLLARARPLTGETVEPAGLGNDVGRCRSVVVLPAGAVALSRTRLRGDNNDVAKRIDVDTMRFKKRPQSDETSAAIAAFLSRKAPKI